MMNKHDTTGSHLDAFEQEQKNYMEPCRVVITVLEAQAALAKAALKSFNYDYTELWNCPIDGTPLRRFIFSRVPGGFLPVAEAMGDPGIPYDFESDASYDYPSTWVSNRYYRDGELEETHADQGTRNPPVHELLRLVGQPDRLVEYVISYAEKSVSAPWAEQLRNSGVHNVRRLIEAEKR